MASPSSPHPMVSPASQERVIYPVDFFRDILVAQVSEDKRERKKHQQVFSPDTHDHFAPNQGTLKSRLRRLLKKNSENTKKSLVFARLNHALQEQFYTDAGRGLSLRVGGALLPFPKPEEDESTKHASYHARVDNFLVQNAGEKTVHPKFFHSQDLPGLPSFVLRTSVQKINQNMDMRIGDSKNLQQIYYYDGDTLFYEVRVSLFLFNREDNPGLRIQVPGTFGAVYKSTDKGLELQHFYAEGDEIQRILADPDSSLIKSYKPPAKFLPTDAEVIGQLHFAAENIVPIELLKWSSQYREQKALPVGSKSDEIVRVLSDFDVMTQQIVEAETEERNQRKASLRAIQLFDIFHQGWWSRFWMSDEDKAELKQIQGSVANPLYRSFREYVVADKGIRENTLSWWERFVSLFPTSFFVQTQAKIRGKTAAKLAFEQQRDNVMSVVTNLTADSLKAYVIPEKRGRQMVEKMAALEMVLSAVIKCPEQLFMITGSGNLSLIQQIANAVKSADENAGSVSVNEDLRAFCNLMLGDGESAALFPELINQPNNITTVAERLCNGMLASNALFQLQARMKSVSSASRGEMLNPFVAAFFKQVIQNMSFEQKCQLYRCLVEDSKLKDCNQLRSELMADSVFVKQLLVNDRWFALMSLELQSDLGNRPLTTVLTDKFPHHIVYYLNTSPNSAVILKALYLAASDAKQEKLLTILRSVPHFMKAVTRELDENELFQLLIRGDDFYKKVFEVGSDPVVFQKLNTLDQTEKNELAKLVLLNPSLSQAFDQMPKTVDVSDKDKFVQQILEMVVVLREQMKAGNAPKVPVPVSVLWRKPLTDVSGRALEKDRSFGFGNGFVI